MSASCIPRLHSLAPRGIGTEDVESLYSYVLRLANSHEIALNPLLRQLGPHTGQNLANSKHYVDQVHDTRFGGGNAAVQQWVGLLEAATGMQGLRSLTYASYGRIFTGRGSGAMRRQWCPHCLDSDLVKFGDPHLRLLWTVGHVTACPVHGCKLECVCPHCGEGATPQGRKAKRMSMLGPGACGACGAWLGALPMGGDAEARSVNVATDKEVCEAREIANLVARPLLDGESVVVNKVLTEASRLYFGGSMVGLAKWVGLNKSTVHGWLSGKVIPELARLVDLALKLHIGLRELIVGDVAALPASLACSSAGLDRRERQTPAPDAKRAMLETWLASADHVSVRGIANELGISHRDVYHYIGAAARIYVAHKRELRLEQRAHLVANAQRTAQDTIEAQGGGLHAQVRLTRDAVQVEYPQFSYSDLMKITRDAANSVPFEISEGSKRRA